jgi:hypothetical protein
MSLLIRNSAGKPLNRVAYRYSGQPVYSLHELIDDSYETILQLHSGPGHITDRRRRNKVSAFTLMKPTNQYVPCRLTP